MLFRSNILFDYQIFCMQTYGGISRYFCELASQLHRFEDAVAQVLAPVHRNAHLARIDPAIVSGVKIPTIPCTRPFIRTMSRVGSRVWPGAMTPDILHPTYYSPDPIDNSKAMVLTVFDMIHERMPGIFDGRDSTSRLKKSAVERADHVICISENTREDLVELFGIEAGKTSVVHLGHTVRGHLADIKPAITAPYILYVGMRQGHKNFDALLSAYGASHHLQHNFKLLCAGGEIGRAHV